MVANPLRTELSNQGNDLVPQRKKKQPKNGLAWFSSRGVGVRFKRAAKMVACALVKFDVLRVPLGSSGLLWVRVP